MDNNYGVFDETVLKAGPTPPPYQPPCIETLLIKPTIISANMQLSHAVGFYDRIKCEDMASDISGMFSRAAAQQRYEKVQLIDTLRCPTSALGVDFRGLRSSPAQSFVPAYDVMDFVASSSSFNFLTSSENRSSSVELGKSTSAYAFTNRMGMHVHDHGGDGVKPLNMVMTSPLSSFPKDNMGQGLEPAQTSKYMGHSVTKAINVFEDSSEGISNVPSDHFSPDLMIARFLDSPNSPNSPSKQDSTLSTEDLDTDWSKSQSQSSCKRRKTQQKKVVFVPTGDAKQLKGETPPSDLWAWRKYGQKPIKGSPYPRGYYRCSSSKGCSARKQVERSCTDPTMLIVTYTSDHNHAWPASKTTANSQTPPKPPHSKDTTSEDRSEEAATSSCEVVNENLFSSIINSASKIDEQVVSSLDSLHGDESFSSKRDVDLCFFSSTSTTEEDGVFDDLGELPELSSIFSKGYLEDLRHTDDVAWFA